MKFHPVPTTSEIERITKLRMEVAYAAGIAARTFKEYGFTVEQAQEMIAFAYKVVPEYDHSTPPPTAQRKPGRVREE